MCGRNSLFVDQADLEARFDAEVVTDGGYTPRYNIAPGDDLHIITNESPDEIDSYHWGLIPFWADEPQEGIINARAETVWEKPSFEPAVHQVGTDETTGEASNRNDDGWGPRDGGRCLVPADGFYEWGDTGAGRGPHRVEVREGALFAMAGLWTRWTPANRQAGLTEFDGAAAGPAPRYTFTILTTAANATLEPLHDRMPVILAQGDERRWLTADRETATPLLEPFAGEMRSFPVSDAVNDPANDVPAVAKPLEG